MMNGFKWEDATSYSQGQRGNIEPSAWTCSVGHIHIWLGNAHRYYPGIWIMHCHELGFSEKKIGAVQDIDLVEARRRALSIASDQAKHDAQVLMSVAAQIEAVLSPQDGPND